MPKVKNDEMVVKVMNKMEQIKIIPLDHAKKLVLRDAAKLLWEPMTLKAYEASLKKETKEKEEKKK